MAAASSSTVPGWVQDVERSRSRGPSTYALATLSLDQTRPEVRNIGLKSLITLFPTTSPGRRALLCSTDARTPKVLQLAKNPECSLTTWVPEESLQIRIQARGRTFSSRGWIAGEITHLDGVELDMKQLRREMWHSESFFGRTRAWHANPTPGSDLTTSREGWTETLAVPSGYLEDNLEESTRSEDAETQGTKMLDSALGNQETDSPETRSYKNFALIVFEPYEVDVVRMVKSGYDRRTRWTKRGDEWTSKEVVP